jgi:transketolase
MTAEDSRRMTDQAFRVRQHIVRMSGGGGCFIGASLSCADLVVYLYERVLDISPTTVTSRDRDYFFLSKGHDVPALYGALAERGYIDSARLDHHLQPGDNIYWHPSRAIPGVEFHSGSLGHLLSVSIGVAMGIRLDGGPGRAFVVLGDGELDEGSVWEGALVAGAKRLENLVVIVDRNEFQANIETESLIPLEPLADKWRAFGFGVVEVNGHDFADIERGFSILPLVAGHPTVVIARTVRGKGLPSIERRADRWFARFTEEEVNALLAELAGTARANLTSETLVVR